MNMIAFAIVFCITLFLYLHIQYHLKTEESLDLITIYSGTKEDIEFACNTRQPILIHTNCAAFEAITLSMMLSQYYMFDVTVRHVTENDVKLQLHASKVLMDEDETSSYTSETNNDFLTESGIKTTMQTIDWNLRPSFVFQCKYDVLFGSKQAHTPFRYNIQYRNFYVATQGTATVLLSPPHYSHYFSPQYDYDIFEFKSVINVWNPQPEYATEFSKAKCIQLTLIPGQILHIPAYWWYSIRFETSNTCVLHFNYSTCMSTLSTLPYTSMHILQLLNTHYNIKT